MVVGLLFDRESDAVVVDVGRVVVGKLVGRRGTIKDFVTDGKGFRGQGPVLLVREGIIVG